LAGLQEVSRLWTCRFFGICGNHNYSFIPANYGHFSNGYMGVAIAIPNDVYEIVQVDITRIAEWNHSFFKVFPPFNDYAFKAHD
jgi:hypothetical protein